MYDFARAAMTWTKKEASAKSPKSPALYYVVRGSSSLFRRRQKLHAKIDDGVKDSDGNEWAKVEETETEFPCYILQAGCYQWTGR